MLREQWWTWLEKKKKKKEVDLVVLVAHGDTDGYSRWCCYWWIGWQMGLSRATMTRMRERERERERMAKIGCWRVVFWPILDPNFSTSRPWKSNLFIGDGKGTLCLFWYRILAIGFTWKNPNHWFKVAMMNCQFCSWKWLVRLATLGRCHRLYSLE